MRPRDRVQVFFVGVVLGSLLVGLLMARKAARQAGQDAAPPPALDATTGEPLPPLPEAVPGALLRGQVVAHGFLPAGAADPASEVWIARFDGDYPLVRVVRHGTSGELDYMAADQVMVVMKEGVDVTVLDPLLKETGLRVRMFNRRENLLVVGVVDAGRTAIPAIDAVPATIEALAPAAEFCRDVGPDTIVFRN